MEACPHVGCQICDCAAFCWRWQRSGSPILALGRLTRSGAMADPKQLIDDLPRWLHGQSDGALALQIACQELRAGRWFLPAQRELLLAEWRRLGRPVLHHKPGFVIGYLPAWFRLPAAVDDFLLIETALASLGAATELEHWRLWRQRRSG